MTGKELFKTIQDQIIPEFRPASQEPYLTKAGIFWMNYARGIIVVFGIRIGRPEDNMDGKFVTEILSEDSLEEIGLSPQEICDIAVKNVAKTAVVEDVGRMLTELTGLDWESELVGSFPIIVVTNQYAYRGAAAIMSPAVIRRVQKRLGETFMIFPSSMHEVICIKDKTIGADEGSALTESINMITVAPEDRLSDCMYRFDGHEVVCAGEYS